MELEDDGDDVARRGDVRVRLLRTPEDAGTALGFLDAAGSVVDAPLVDEAERERLRVRGGGATVPDHRAAVATRGGDVVGYLGVVVRGATATADVAVPGPDAGAAALTATLAGAVTLARGEGVGQLEVWLRRADEPAVEHARASGFAVERRLAILGRRLDGPPSGVSPPAGVTIRAYRPDEDDAAVVAVLAEAYAGTPEAGWDLAAFRARRGYDWFVPQDLLLAEADDGLLGLHWTKRRSPTVGEVYNLAVSPRAQGRRLGVALLLAGLAHLHGVGMRDVLLWVDRANERAVGLYRAHGFSLRWQDVALRRRIG